MIHKNSPTDKNSDPLGEKTRTQTEDISLHQDILDFYLEVLANTYRRQLLTTLLEQDQPVDIHSLIPATVATSNEDVDNLTIQMIHKHLPKLDSAEIIEWDQETEQVVKGPRFEDIRPLIQMIETRVR